MPDKWKPRRWPRGRPWLHVGGGTLFSAVNSNKKYPCDDEYQHQGTGESLVLATTLEAHFGRLPRLANLRRILGRPGVRLHKRKAFDSGG